MLVRWKLLLVLVSVQNLKLHGELKLGVFSRASFGGKRIRDKCSKCSYLQVKKLLMIQGWSLGKIEFREGGTFMETNRCYPKVSCNSVKSSGPACFLEALTGSMFSVQQNTWARKLIALFNVPALYPTACEGTSTTAELLQDQRKVLVNRIMS